MSRSCGDGVTKYWREKFGGFGGVPILLFVTADIDHGKPIYRSPLNPYCIDPPDPVVAPARPMPKPRQSVPRLTATDSRLTDVGK